MERRFELRKEELMVDSEVHPAVFDGMMSRLERFAEPFAECLRRPEQREHAQTYVRGLLSDVEKKNAEAIAYRHDQDRQGLQTFIGTAPWDHGPLLEELTRQVGQQLGESDGVILFDPSAFPKKGSHSVGVARQWCGRLGKVDNCQVGIFMGYASRSEQALVDMRLYLSREWAKDRKRCKECGVPKAVRYQTRHELALEMLDGKGHLLPHAWVTGDDEMGRPAWFRRALDERTEQYLLAVPSNTTIRDLEAQQPPYSGRGRKPKRPFQQVRAWCESLPQHAWTRLEVRDGDKGPLTVEIVKRRVVAKIDRKIGPKETLVVIRWVDEEGRVKHDYHLSNASAETPLKEFARVANAAHRIEQCIKRGKSEAGMADYQVRTWIGWHHHITLSLIATWFLVQEAGRGKKMDAGHHGPADSYTSCPDLAQRLRMRHARSNQTRMHALASAQRTGTTLSPPST
ncbi:MAG: IS701 family transposase [Planctomycetes bacterium]|nr:IS701 family transposase [Planctomycetota bacterium]